MKPMTDSIDFAALVDALPDPVIVVDTDVRLHWVNPAGVLAFGWRPEAWLGRSMLDMVHPDDVASVISSTGTIQSKRVGTPVAEQAVRRPGPPAMATPAARTPWPTPSSST